MASTKQLSMELYVVLIKINVKCCVPIKFFQQVCTGCRRGSTQYKVMITTKLLYHARNEDTWGRSPTISDPMFTASRNANPEK